MAHFVLDVNETLSDMSPIGDVLAAHGATAEMAHTWFASVLRDGFALSLQHRAPPFLQLARQVLRRCLERVAGLDAEVEEVIEHVFDTLAALRVHPDVVPGIRVLTDAGHDVTTFSNGSSEATRGLLERAGVLERVGRVLSVENDTVWKPHPAAYTTASEALGSPPAALTMVAVHPWDLDGAASAGLRTAWLDRNGTTWPESFQTPDLRVDRLQALAG